MDPQSLAIERFFLIEGVGSETGKRCRLAAACESSRISILNSLLSSVKLRAVSKVRS